MSRSPLRLLPTLLLLWVSWPSASAAALEPRASSPPPAPPPAAAPAPSPPPIPAEALAPWLDGVLREQLAETRVPALAALVLHHGEVVAEAAAGERCAECASAVTTSDLWHIGSCTKAMTATLAAVLVAEGKLAWDLTLEKAFPAWAERMKPEYRSVTLRDLLRMRGRIPGNPPAAAWAAAWMLEGTPIEQRRRFCEAVLTSTVPLPAGRFEYSNQAYSLAGLICEEAAGEPFEQLLATRLGTPLGLRTLGFGPPPAERGASAGADASGPAECEATQPCGHRASAGGAVATVWPGPQADNPPVLSPAGRVHLSLRDWASFAQVHLRGERDGAPRLGLDAQAFRTLHEPAPPAAGADPGAGAPDAAPYALGWVVRSHETFGPVLWHNGSNTMWYAEMWLAPDRDLAVLVACNRAGDAAERAVRGALAILLKRFAATP